MPQRNPRATKQPSLADIQRAHGVVLEQINSQMRMVVEGVNASVERLEAKIDSAVARLSDRISLLEEAVRQSSRDIRALQEEVARLRHDFDHREELGRVDALEARVSAIESRLAMGSR